jgi:hypothetical protein
MTRLPLIPIALASASLAAVVPQFIGLGFTHILPHGLDHILFILGLFLVARDSQTLLYQTTLFTMAHSMSLGLAMQGMLSVPDRAVEIAIGLSIAFIALENLYHARLSRWRPAMVVAFGLVHGLGFAHSFEHTTVAPGNLLPALFSFNLGIELGQLTVIAVAYAAAAAWWQRDWYVERVCRPASVAIACAGLYLAAARCW